MAEQRIIDLRSDTVTVPSDGMREAIASAPVGDDVYGEDPTVNRLEQMSAQITGKEAALFVASGSMGNLVATMSHCARGDEAICGSEAHILQYESASAAAVAGVQLRTVENDARGRIDPAAVEALIRPDNVHMPRTSLVLLENTHNRCGGAAIPLAGVEAVAAVAHGRGVPVHMDGARIFNAALDLGTSVAALCAPVDTAGFCLSKGLGAPVGSLVCGPAEFIVRARRMRKQLGGGMRQAGILAAAGIYALEHMTGRLADDHANARLLARGLAAIPMVDLDPAAVETNIVIFRVPDAPDFLRSLRRAGVLAGSPGPGRVRMVTHYGIEPAHIQEALDRIRDAVRTPA